MDTGTQFDKLKQDGKTTKDAVMAVISELSTYEDLLDFVQALRTRGYIAT